MSGINDDNMTMCPLEHMKDYYNEGHLQGTSIVLDHEKMIKNAKNNIESADPKIG